MVYLASLRITHECKRTHIIPHIFTIPRAINSGIVVLPQVVVRALGTSRILNVLRRNGCGV